MKEYRIVEYYELIVTRCGQWTGNREFIWSGLSLIDLEYASVMLSAHYHISVVSVLSTGTKSRGGCRVSRNWSSTFRQYLVLEYQRFKSRYSNRAVTFCSLPVKDGLKLFLGSCSQNSAISVVCFKLHIAPPRFYF